MKKKLFSLLLSTIITFSCCVAAAPNVFAASITDAEYYRIGSTTTVTITESNREVFYEFDLDESGRVHVDLKLITMEQYSYWLYDNNGSELYYDSYQSHNGSFDWDLSAGTYYVKFRDHIGSLNMSTNFTSANVNHNEDNNKKINAAYIEIGDKINTILTKNKNEEFFEFELDESGHVHTDLKLVTMEQYSYWLYDDNGNELYYDSYQSHNGSFDWDLLEGTYYIKFCYALGSFNFTTKFTSANVNHDEDNEKRINALTISLNKMYNSFIAKNKSEEYFTFAIKNPEEISLDINLNSCEHYSYNISDDSGKTIKYDEYQKHNESIDIQLDAGTYYIRFYNAPGSFSFMVSDSRGNYYDDIDDENNTNNPTITTIPESVKPTTPKPVTPSPATPSPATPSPQNQISGSITNKPVYSDVDEYNDCFDAVNILSALDIISGYEDGSFKPYKSVTRAEMAKLVVAALGETEMAEESKHATKFSDSRNHWARGYINRGVADCFIAGYNDREFGPDDNVTYMQAMKMLVSAIGYETYAQQSGGWPNGYKKYGDNLGIGNGVHTSMDSYLDRGEVAIMLYNAMRAPVCVIMEFATTVNGANIPVLEVKDGTGSDFKSLFTMKHDTYIAQGYIKPSTTEFVITYAQNFDDEYYIQGSEKEIDIKSVYRYNGDIYYNCYGTAYIKMNESSDYYVFYMTANE